MSLEINNDPNQKMSMKDEHFFIGRNKEIEIFMQHIKQVNSNIKLLHIYGIGGVGKTFLLDEYERLSQQDGFFFVKMDSQDFPQTPIGFTQYLFSLLEIKSNHKHHNQNNEFSINRCFQRLEDIAHSQKIVIAVDSFEHMMNLNSWFREVFIRHLPDNLLVVTASRSPLKGKWEESPVWRKSIIQLGLKQFNYEQTNQFLEQYDLNNKQLMHEIWKFSAGHPLTLSLASIVKADLNQFARTLPENNTKVLIELTKRWLQEVRNGGLYPLIEAASLFVRFDQTSLSAITGQEISLEDFQKLESLSFIRMTNSGWTMHNLMKDAVKVELKHRNPDRYQLLCEQMASYLYRRVISTRSINDIAQFFNHLGDEAIQSIFFLESIDDSMYLEPVETYNFHEVITFFKYNRGNVQSSQAEFYHRETNKTYQFHASSQHNEKELQLIGADYVEKMGYNCAQLLKSESGDILGLSIVVPINKSTLKYLSEEPVSRAYFTRLKKKQWNEYAVPEDKVCGWFIRLLEFTGTESMNASARSFMMYHLFPKLLSGGKIVISNPLPFYQNLIKMFGFAEVSGATHYDYGENSPSPTYLLDVSGPKLAAYLKQFTDEVSQTQQFDIVINSFELTNREKDVVKLILEDKSNAEIANQLFLAEVTIKKHVSRIFKKMSVNSRTQLIKRIMELLL
ncbi:LuxR C-terminal-related transcriptional regulator [Radiobacillus sp. PE A8.2]|uniref:LuxR C-terminal-related transcriptional regulator n=1 Tax=Radiobacillus sp. PE A8.2 TaxID=3380349 RepID=UPI00388E2102